MFVAVCGLSLVAARGLYFLAVVQGFPITGASLGVESLCSTGSRPSGSGVVVLGPTWPASYEIFPDQGLN